MRSEDGLNERDAVSVDNVSGYGTDWDGDTEGGFFSSFEVIVYWTDTAGKKHHRDIVGEEMGSLWHHVVNLW